MVICSVLVRTWWEEWQILVFIKFYQQARKPKKQNMPKVADIHIHDFGCFGIYIGPGFVRTWILFTLDALLVLVYYPSDKLHISFWGKTTFWHWLIVSKSYKIWNYVKWCGWLVVLLFTWFYVQALHPLWQSV